jgi:hypothetical protein
MKHSESGRNHDLGSGRSNYVVQGVNTVWMKPPGEPNIIGQTFGVPKTFTAYQNTV